METCTLVLFVHYIVPHRSERHGHETLAHSTFSSDRENDRAGEEHDKVKGEVPLTIWHRNLHSGSVHDSVLHWSEGHGHETHSHKRHFSSDNENGSHGEHEDSHAGIFFKVET